jgi:hypothetical protein
MATGRRIKRGSRHCVDEFLTETSPAGQWIVFLEFKYKFVSFILITCLLRPPTGQMASILGDIDENPTKMKSPAGVKMSMTYVYRTTEHAK